MDIIGFLKEGLLLSPEVLEKQIQVLENPKNLPENRPLVCDSFFFENIQSKNFDLFNWLEYDKLKVEHEKTGNDTDFLQAQVITDNQPNNIEIIESFKDKNVKTNVKDFVNLYNSRYLLIQSFLRQRQELESATSIRKIGSLGENEPVSFIAMILDIGITKNENIMLTLEDQTGIIKAVITKNNKETYTLAKDLTQDEVIGIQGSKGTNIVFVKSLILPDIPLNKGLKKSPDDEAAIFISDLHIGSKAFLKKPFENLIEWINGRIENVEQKQLIKKIKYMFIIGDIVDGIGVYPDQEKDLEIKDILCQYDQFTEYISKIPETINIIICPGNHDSVRVAEPQPPLPQEVIFKLTKQKNIFLVSSPSIIKIGMSKSFSGFDFLIYHGYSFPYYSDSVESIRLKGGINNVENIMLYLLKKRHLAPTHGSTQYQLGYDKDPLVIKTIPDFFVSGHIHKICVKNYRDVTMVNCSCWVAQTEYQEKRGISPDPAKVIYVDLKTRESKIFSFLE